MNDLNARYFSKFNGDQIDEAIKLIYEFEDENTFFKGVFLSSNVSVLNGIPSPKLGDYAYMGTSIQALSIYTYNGGNWESSGNTVDISGYNIPSPVRGDSDSLTMSQKVISSGLENLENNLGVYKIFSNFSPTIPYPKGSYTLYNGKLYKSNIDVIPGDFTLTQWDLSSSIEYLIDQSSKTLIGLDEFNNLKSSVNDLEDLVRLENSNRLTLDDRGHLIHIYEPQYPMDFMLVNGHLMLKEYI